MMSVESRHIRSRSAVRSATRPFELLARLEPAPRAPRRCPGCRCRCRTSARSCPPRRASAGHARASSGTDRCDAAGGTRCGRARRSPSIRRQSAQVRSRSSGWTMVSQSAPSVEPRNAGEIVPALVVVVVVAVRPGRPDHLVDGIGDGLELRLALAQPLLDLPCGRCRRTGCRPRPASRPATAAVPR